MKIEEAVITMDHQEKEMAIKSNLTEELKDLNNNNKEMNLLIL